VADLAAAHIAALPLLDHTAGPRVLNCGYGRGSSVRQVLRAVEQACGRALDIRYLARRAGDPSEVVADNRLLLSHTDWRPRFDDMTLMVREAVAGCVVAVEA
jgi:UDP-glucose 4-epimerase